MKKILIAIGIFTTVATTGVVTYNSVNNNVYAEETSLELEIQLLKSEIAILKDTLVTKTELIAEQTRIDEMQIQNETLDTKLNTAVSDIGILQNQGQIINALKSRVINLEQSSVNKVAGTWKYESSDKPENIIYTFNSNGTGSISNKETGATTNITYNNIMIMISHNIRFYNLINDNTIIVYQLNYANSTTTRAYTLTKIQ